MATVRRTVLSVDGVRTPVLIAGSREHREAVVFVHGNPGPGDDWRELVGSAGEHTLAIAPDMPGFGAADKPRHFDYTIAGYAAHLAALLSCLRIDRAHLVLHDFGGPWGLAWAVRHPNAFASATLIGTGVLPDYRWHRLARLWRTPGAGELFMLSLNRPAARLLAGRENPRLRPEHLNRIYEAMRAPDTKRAILKLYRSAPAAAMRGPIEALAQLDRPALVLWGTEDPYLPVAQAERQREAFPSARVELLQGASHWPFLEDPDRVRELLIPFLVEQLVTHAAGAGSRLQSAS